MADVAVLKGTRQPGFIMAQDLSLRDVRMKAYEHVSLNLDRGMAHAICAEDKGGKTELLLTLAGRMHPTSGSCVVDGNDVRTFRGMIATSKIASLAFFENVNDVERVLRVRTIASAELGLAGKRSNSQATKDFLEEWGLSEVSDCTIEELPRAIYDQLGIALAMAHDPKILCVQDIERDLTEQESMKLCDMLRNLAAERGVTVLCGVLDFDLATRFDTVSCITDSARAQQTAWRRKHHVREVA